MPTAGLEQAMGIEPTTEAWEAAILPLNYACMLSVIYHTTRGGQKSRGKGKFSPVNRLPESAGWTGDGSGAGMCGNRKEERRRTAAAAGGGKSRRRRKQTPRRSRMPECAAEEGERGTGRHRRRTAGTQRGKKAKSSAGRFSRRCTSFPAPLAPSDGRFFGRCGRLFGCCD